MTGGKIVKKARRSAWMLLALAAFAASIAVVLFLNYVSAVESQFGEFEEVLIAGRDIAARVPITGQALESVRIPKRYLRPGLLIHKEDAVNRISLIALSKGEFISSSMLREEPIPSGMRSLTMTASQSVVIDSEFRVGDRVDVMAAFREDGKDVSRVVVQDLEVIGAVLEGRQKQLTLLVRSEIATQLMWMENYGKQVRFVRSRLAKQGE